MLVVSRGSSRRFFRRTSLACCAIMLLRSTSHAWSPRSLSRFGRPGGGGWHRRYPVMAMSGNFRSFSHHKGRPTTQTTLTRTQVHRMRVTELRAALGITDDSDATQKQGRLKRPQLVSLLLDTLESAPKSFTGGIEASVNEPTKARSRRHTATLSGRHERRRTTELRMTRTALNGEEHEAEATTSSFDAAEAVAVQLPDEEQTQHATSDTKDALGSDTDWVDVGKSLWLEINNDKEEDVSSTKDVPTLDSSSEEVPMPVASDDVSIDPQPRYTLHVKGIVASSPSLPRQNEPWVGTGIGWSILQHFPQNDTATAPQNGSLYFPTTRSIYEAEYTALILGLRHLVQSYRCHDDERSDTDAPPHSLHIVTDDDVVYHQMTHWYPVEKPSLIPLVQMVRDLQAEWERMAPTNTNQENDSCVSFHYHSPDTMADVHALALAALTDQQPVATTLRDDDPLQSFWDTMLPPTEEEEIAVSDDDEDAFEVEESANATSEPPPKPTATKSKRRLTAPKLPVAAPDTSGIQQPSDTAANGSSKGSIASDPFAFLTNYVDYNENETEDIVEALASSSSSEPEDDDDALSTTLGNAQEQQTLPDVQSSDEKSETDPIAIDPLVMYVLQFDGGARGNSQGVAGCGATVLDPTLTQELWYGYRFLGDSGITNNQAEYEGVVLGLTRARDLGITRIRCEGDSQLVIRQLSGSYKVKNARLRELHGAAKQVMESFEECTLRHVARKDNSRADALANAAMNERMSMG